MIFYNHVDLILEQKLILSINISIIQNINTFQKHAITSLDKEVFNKIQQYFKPSVETKDDV